MASDESRIPAWRRLGLALKNEDQSTVTVPESHTIHSDSQHNAPYGAPTDTHDHFQSPVEPAVNGKPSKLGKRKHQPEPAEDGGQNAKKNKTTSIGDEINGTAGFDHPLVVNPAKAEAVPASEETPATDTARPKGDANYRKKKAKPNKRRKEDPHVAQTAPAPIQSGRESFSPDGSATNGRPNLLASTETDHAGLAPTITLQKHQKRSNSTKDSSGSPSRKSVAFTSDTKTDDGNSGQELFKKWVAEQSGTGAVSAPPEVSNFTLHSLIAEEVKAARKNGQLEKEQDQSSEEPASQPDELEQSPVPRAAPTAKPTASREEKPTPATTVPSTSKGKKKDPSVYIAYLTQYHTDRDHWKFNKAKQNDVVDNALNIFRIPIEHSEALLEYVSGLKGAGVIERLKERCLATLKELDEQDAQNPMDDVEARKAAEEEAQQERIAKERKRRKVEGDVETFMGHPHGDGYIRRMRRTRAEALLTALGRTAPILPAITHTNGINPMMKTVVPPQRDSKKRKRRNDISSDESSSDDSSSSSDSDSDSDDSKSDSDSDEDGEKGSSSDSSASDSSDSDSDSDSG